MIDKVGQANGWFVHYLSKQEDFYVCFSGFWSYGLEGGCLSGSVVSSGLVSLLCICFDPENHQLSADIHCDQDDPSCVLWFHQTEDTLNLHALLSYPRSPPREGLFLKDWKRYLPVSGGISSSTSVSDCDWCCGRVIASVLATVQKLTDNIFPFHWDKHLSVSSLKGYYLDLDHVLAVNAMGLFVPRKQFMLMRVPLRNPVLHMKFSL